MNFQKRILAMLLSVVACVGSVSYGVFASQKDVSNDAGPVSEYEKIDKNRIETNRLRRVEKTSDLPGFPQKGFRLFRRFYD